MRKKHVWQINVSILEHVDDEKYRLSTNAQRNARERHHERSPETTDRLHDDAQQHTESRGDETPRTKRRC